ncbi:TPA: DUF551 domain-containing protein [Stenotrophomonas maltophilia]
MSEIELKPCPFCGGSAFMVQEGTHAQCLTPGCCVGPVSGVDSWNVRAPQWQPIESAPKTTRYILVWCPERQNQYMVSWDGRYEGEWRTVGGWTALTEAPTHWMPLPAPPEVV